LAKNIVICCDGTANEFSKDRTNVAKLFHVFPKRVSEQVCYYHPGVGTMAPPGFVTQGGIRVAELIGLAFGYGLTNDIRDAYTFLADTFEPEDKLFLFGFSRGSYTVRALASVLRMYGLIPPKNQAFIPYIVRMLWEIQSLRRRYSGSENDREATAAYFRLASEFKATFSTVCQPHFIGVWDTVSSVGWFTSPVALPYTANNQDIAVGRHAVSIDERRAFFRPNLWVPRAPDVGPRDLRQVWFPGVHSDVGGGYPEAESGLSKFPLQWMIEEASAHGLQIDSDRVSLVLGLRGHGYVQADPNSPSHESLTPSWKLLEYVRLPRWNATTRRRTWQANHGARRQIPDGAVVHDAAWDRDSGRYAERLPAGAIRLSQATWSPPLT
jgi:uncharacterized protein (DUF2235 family)